MGISSHRRSCHLSFPRRIVTRTCTLSWTSGSAMDSGFRRRTTPPAGTLPLPQWVRFDVCLDHDDWGVRLLERDLAAVVAAPREL